MKKIHQILSIMTMALCFVVSAQAGSPPQFEDWLNREFKPLALNKGITPETLNRAFQNVKHMPQSITFDGKQPEQTQSLIQYQEKRIPPRIVTARKKAKKHGRVLDTVQNTYGVPKEMILSLWGLESNFGTNMGQFIIVHTLATLAFEGRRREFFTRELVEALKILQNQSMHPHHLKGSWAGAMGQCQFMPSTFNAHAVDATKKGYKDIWNSTDDVFASIANYLVNSGWKPNEPWGLEVTLPDGFDERLATLSVQKSKQDWAALGVKPAKKDTSLPDLQGSLLIPENQKKAFLVYNNFRVILKWNRSTCFALTVCQFADQIRSYQ